MIYLTIQRLLLILMVVAFSPAYGSGQGIGFPKTCYYVITGGLKIPVDEVLFVAIDETVGFDQHLKKEIERKIFSWLRPGRAIEIMRFSSGVTGQYADIVVSGRLDPASDEAYLSDITIKAKKNLQSCLRKRKAYTRALIHQKLDKVFKHSDKRIAHSDIIYNIKLLANRVHAYSAHKKIVLVVSDMLENSSITSFYYKGHIRKLKLSDEFKKIKQKGMNADFGSNVTAYVMGLGYFWTGESGKKERYLDPVRTRLISEFWSKYFQNSGAMVGEIGAPTMYGEIKVINNSKP